MATHKPGRGPLDVKLARGGLVDLEFLIHYLQLREGTALSPRLDTAIAQLVAQGLLPTALVQAHDDLARMLVAARLLSPDSQMPSEAARRALAKACGYGDWNALSAALDAARAAVAQAWQAEFGEVLEVK